LELLPLEELFLREVVGSSAGGEGVCGRREEYKGAEERWEKKELIASIADIKARRLFIEQNLQ
jgi:hypothetical protein